MEGEEGSEPKTARDKEIIEIGEDQPAPVRTVKEYRGNLDITFGECESSQTTILLSQDVIKFRGLSFSLADRTNPKRILSDAPFTREHSDLITFLKIMHEKGIFNANKQKG